MSEMETGKIGGESHYMCRHIVNERNKLKQENEELRVYMERLTMHIDHLCFTCAHEGNPCDRTAKGFITSCCSDYNRATPSQSLQSIKAEVEEEVIERCKAEVAKYYGAGAGSIGLRAMERKYS